MKTDRKIWIAVILIVAGGLLLLDNLRVFDFSIPRYFMEWYSFFVYVGIFLIIARDRSSAGIIFLAIGGFFLLEDVFRLSFMDLWPVILIAVGVSILLRRYRHSDEHNTPNEINPGDFDGLDELSVFSGSKRFISSKNFKGGKVTTIFGASEINLKDAKLAEGTNVIDIFSMFGGSTILVPSDWKVLVKINPIFGGYEDKRIKLHDVEVSGRELVITGNIIFGGGEIRSI